jgi:hypothetical protein
MCDFLSFLTSATAASNFSLASDTSLSHSYLICKASEAALDTMTSSSATNFC